MSAAGARSTDPDVGASRPASTRSSVDFPAPLRPSTPMRLPASIDRSTPSSTTRGPRITVTFRAASIDSG